MFLLALLLILMGFAAWRVKARVGFPLSRRLATFQWVAWGLGAALALGAMAIVVPPGQAGSRCSSAV